ncbi:hypothetical protein GCM10010992_27120 [Cloacibacterium rupense]|uniref:Por secretion system C-terminal sorting domain-containing protein n=1 Tax=Cloacibacterium rupense TaxID=517423 RepID=A0ABQ2NNR4_9FLAO|nr:T9SS type A sorting domain-containing protein [Cloacibacterium rupense]GGP06574.1 hypothetical protein GCM10010992_27120 [Cloacibacterium rupense]
MITNNLSFLKAFFRLLFIISSIYGWGQVTLLDPTGDGGFETGNTFALNNWNAANTGSNKNWSIGNSAHIGVSNGSRAAFIGNSSQTGQTRITHLYRTLSIPVGATNIQLSFKYRQTAVDTNNDLLRVYLNNNTPIYATAQSAGLLTTVNPSNPSNTYSSFTNVSVTIPNSYAGTTNNLIFTFFSNNNTPNAFGGFDEVSVTYSPANDAGVTTVPTLTCQGTQNVVATIRNYGTSNLTSATINWSVNGAAQTPFSWTGNLATNATANVTIGSFNFSPSTNYSITAFTSLPNGVTDNNTTNDNFTTASFQTNSGPTDVNITNANEVVCKNTVKTLTATGGVVNNAVIFSENFNSGIGTFTQTNSSTGGTPANAAWTNRANGYTYLSFFTFNSNDNSNFMLSNSDSQGFGSTTSTTLTSPLFSLVGCTSPILNFYHHFFYASGDTAKVQISTNGGTSFTDLVTYTSSQGGTSSFSLVSIDLSAYAGQSNLMIRFKYDASYGWWWAIDNVSVVANRQNITWSSSPSSPNTIFTDAAATVPYVSGTHATTVYVKPTVTTTYTATSTNGGCTTTDVVTYSMETAVYNGSSWTPAQVSNRAIEFQGNYTSPGTGINLQACSCTVTSGTVKIASGDTMTLQDEMIVNGGSITFENNANLLQTNPNAINTGNIIVKRKAKMKRLDYTYWSAPVTGQNLKSFSPNTLNSRFYVYNEATDFFSTIDPLSNSFATAAGYAIRAPNNYLTSTTTQDWTFTGVPINGTKTINITKNGRGFNLIGNPYPSNISFTSFYSANSTIIQNKAFFWTNTNVNPPAQQGASYSGNNYATLTSTGGTPATNSSIAPTNEIAVGQGFIVEKTNAGTSAVTFNNTMRTNTNGVFFNSRLAPSKQSPKYWLKLTTPAKNFNTLLVGYVPGATNGLDASFDAEPIAMSSDMFYSIQDDKNLIIQGRTVNFSTKDKVPLGAILYESGNYEIAISELEGIFQNAQPIYLKDKLLDKMVKLNDGGYSFYAEAGVVNNRFEIVYKPDSTLSIEDLSKNGLQVYQVEGWIMIDSQEGLSRVWISDSAGKSLYESEVKGKTTRVNASHYPSGMYYVTVETSSGQKQTKKILKK